MSSFPSGPVKQVVGRTLVIRGEDIDTDRIIPARFLKCVSFDALGDQVFADDRRECKGEHPFDQERFQGASILMVNGNFGCGSSREHAPQALMRWGIRAVVGVSFAEIFHGNCLALGIPCATAPAAEVESIQQRVMEAPHLSWSLDLELERLTSEDQQWRIAVDEGPRQMLLSGRWDATSQLLAHGPEIQKLMQGLPYIDGFSNS